MNAPSALFLENAAALAEPVVRLDGIERSFGAVHALRGISLALRPGRALALVGESGCGKTTCARIIARMDQPTAGSMHFRGRDITHPGEKAAEAAYRRAVQMVFQDPFASLNPVFSIRHHLARPLKLHGHAGNKTEQERGVADLLGWVGLDPAVTAHKFPHELSGGQRQRVNIARALAVRPDVLVADEPTSMLDVSIRRGILELLSRIKRERQLALLYITHDIATAAHVAEEVIVMFAGQMVEWGSTETVIRNARHPYTKLLLSAVPDPDRPFVPGDSARFLNHAEEVRRISRPASDKIEQVGPNHFIRALGAS
ncbi:ABC-type glutathione transport system ATPase component [Mesorhizobium soli]|jgi:ABC-type glutathione transport system ATPase component|uniref:ABC transporter ATP-binding protein n=1 Tax=Pseudaminobacter soli (ex Li et al. 2025) TaxID=1295366 RepID=UPI0024738513|nr:ABC transporter ATP-binding protein [Mesorhizobium soli]MDH6233527.1 ABC-type glutathione transport system ATPase component [Mesorhizobium soli]